MGDQPTTNQTYTDDMDVDCLTTSLRMNMTNMNSNEPIGNTLTIQPTTRSGNNTTIINTKETEWNSSTDEPNGTMTINATRTHEEEMDIEQPLTPQNNNMFSITNTTLTPITITLPKTSFVHTNDDTLPDLQPIERETTEQQDSANYVDIYDEEPMFMDENVIVPDVEFLHEEPTQVFKFSPLNSTSREECSLLVNIVDCDIIEYTNIGTDLIGKPRNVHNVKGDGNCYFRSISYALSGCEDYYDSVREVLCDYISWFPGWLCALIKDKDELENGSKYIKRSKSRSFSHLVKTTGVDHITVHADRN